METDEIGDDQVQEENFDDDKEDNGEQNLSTNDGRDKDGKDGISGDAPSSTMILTEGKATITFPGESTVFYNPVQEFNRDLSVAILRQMIVDRQSLIDQYESTLLDAKGNKLRRPKFCDAETPGVRVLEALAASGLRAIRYAREVPGVARVIANDFSEVAVECMRKNAATNSVEHIVIPNYSDAVLLMHENKRMDKQFHMVDLDPYGTATPFLDAAVQCVMDEGILMVTCTDVAVLCGNTPEACYAKYGAMSLRAKCCHEIALRILLQCIEAQANRYGRYIEPLLSVSVDFYVRVFVRVHTGAAVAKNSCCKTSLIYQCSNCESFVLQPLAKRSDTAKGGIKYTNALAPTAAAQCEHCGGKHHIAGPVWSAPLHNTDFVKKLLESVKNSSELEHLKTKPRIIGLLSVVLEELQDVPLYYLHDRLANLVHCPVPPMNTFRSALLNASFRVSISHANPRAIKTDAPNHVIWDIMRCWAAKNKCQPLSASSTASKNPTATGDDFKQQKALLRSPAIAILDQAPRLEANFNFHPSADPITRQEGLLRFQMKPQKFWGPKPKAKGSVAILRQMIVDRQSLIDQYESTLLDAKGNKLRRPKFCDAETPGVRVLEALAASGLRAIRYAREVPGVARVIANDFSEVAVECMRKNAATNAVEHIVIPNYSDAVLLMHENKRMDKQFHMVDLDPYGTATPFLDAAVQCVMDEGILMVTCTDVAVLCGNTPEACYAKYGAMSLRAKCCHEIALRILLQCIEAQANRYGRYIEPLLSVSVDFYVRVFVRVHTGAAVAKNSCCKTSLIYQCSNCESFVLQPLAKRSETAKGGIKYTNALAPTAPAQCEHCGGKHHIAGPVWSAPLHNTDFVKKLLESVKNSSELEHLKTRPRIIGLLSVVLEELQDVPLYYLHDRLANLVHCPVPPMNTFRSALLNASFRVSISHANPRAIKTDAPNHVIWDIMRCWAAKNKCQPLSASSSTVSKNTTAIGYDFKVQKALLRSPAIAILDQAPRLEANFNFHPSADPITRQEGLLRFQMKPQKFWGPKPKAKGSISSKRAAMYSGTYQSASNNDHGNGDTAEASKKPKIDQEHEERSKK